MAGPAWNADHPDDYATIAANTAGLITDLQVSAATRELPDLAAVLGWHSALYVGCSVPIAGYVGHFRGDTIVAELVGYEVGIGPAQPDGYPAKVGVWSVDVRRAVDDFLGRVGAAATHLDAALPPGVRPTTVDELESVVGLAAVVHGEWVRIHPFANGSGRTARLWAAWLALRYGLPIFVTVQPRPHDSMHASAGAASMGRPPDFVGDHSVAAHVFTRLLSLALLP